jgi:hypothetical protein
MSLATILSIGAIVFAAGAYALTTRNNSRDLKGLSRKQNKLAAMLLRWNDLDAAAQRKAIADYLEGK